MPAKGPILRDMESTKKRESASRLDLACKRRLLVLALSLIHILSGMAVASAALATLAQQPAPADYTIDIAAYALEVAPRRTVKTIAYNRQVPGPLLRLKEGQPVTINVINQTGNSEVVHWHGLFLPLSLIHI